MKHRRRTLNLLLTSALHTAKKVGYKYTIMVTFTPTPLGYPLPHAISSVITSLKRIRKNIFGVVQNGQFLIARSHKASDELATVVVSADPNDFASSLCCAAAIDRCIHEYKKRLRSPTSYEDTMASLVAESVRTTRGVKNVQGIPKADGTPLNND